MIGSLVLNTIFIHIFIFIFKAYVGNACLNWEMHVSRSITCIVFMYPMHVLGRKKDKIKNFNQNIHSVAVLYSRS